MLSHKIIVGWLGTLIILSLSGCYSPTPNNQSGHPMSTPRFLPAEQDAGQDAGYINKLKALQARDAVQDARQAIAQGQRYFLCNAGRSNTVPGLAPEVYATVRQGCSLQCLEGVTDALDGPNHARYLEAALGYSARWNQTMLNACR